MIDLISIYILIATGLGLTLVHNYQGVSQWCSGTQLLPLSSRGRLGWGFALCLNHQNRIK